MNGKPRRSASSLSHPTIVSAFDLHHAGPLASIIAALDLHLHAAVEAIPILASSVTSSVPGPLVSLGLVGAGASDAVNLPRGQAPLAACARMSSPSCRQTTVHPFTLSRSGHL